MKNTIYLEQKENLKAFAKELSFKDKPARRMALNDYADTICRDLDFEALQGRITEKQSELYKNWLHNFVSELHEKNIK